MGWSIWKEDQILTAKFDGHLSTEEGQASAEAFSEKLEIPRDVIFDVRKMQGYESGLVVRGSRRCGLCETTSSR